MSLQGMGQFLCQLVPGHRLMLLHHLIQFRRPAFILPLHQSQKNLFFVIEIVIDGRTVKAGDTANLLEGYLLEIHGRIKLGTGVDDFLPPGQQKFFRNFRHRTSPLSKIIHIVSLYYNKNDIASITRTKKIPGRINISLADPECQTDYYLICLKSEQKRYDRTIY